MAASQAVNLRSKEVIVTGARAEPFPEISVKDLETLRHLSTGAFIKVHRRKYRSVKQDVGIDFCFADNYERTCLYQKKLVIQ